MRLPTSPRPREGDHLRGVSLENGTAQPDGEWLSRSPQPDIPWTDTKPAKSLAAVAATSRQPWAGRSPTQLFSPSSETQDSAEKCAKRNESKRDHQFSSDQGCTDHAVRAQVRRRAHRGMRALGAIVDADSVAVKPAEAADRRTRTVLRSSR